MIRNAFESNNAVILSAPPYNDKYYSEKYEGIMACYADFTGKISTFHEVVVLADENSAKILEAAATMSNAVHIIRYSPPCLWIRDWFPIRLPSGKLVKLIYRPKYLTRNQSKHIDHRVTSLLTDAMVTFDVMPLVLDGGNVILSHDGKLAIMTTRVLADNPDFSRTEIEKTVQHYLGVEQLILIPPEVGDHTGHADGQIRIISRELMVINQYQEPFRTRLLSTLSRQLPTGTRIVEVPYQPSLQRHQGFPSASGNYVNFIKTDRVLIVPTYGLEKSDKEAVELLSELSDVPTLGVNCSAIATFGGALNCISWT